MRNEGVNPASAATISSLIALPHAIYFLWAPITDFWFERRTWILAAGVATAATILFTLFIAKLGSHLGVGLLFLTASLAVLVPSACGGMMATLQSELNRRRASSFYQTGSLAIGAIAVFSITYFAGRFSLRKLGFVIAAMIALPTLAAFAAPSQPVVSDDTLRATVSRIMEECKATFMRWEAIPYALIFAGPGGSGAMIGLLSELARDYGVTSRQVAWVNGIGGVLLTSAGALAASLIPARVCAPVAFLISSLINAASLAILALGRLSPPVYLTGTILYLFTIGASYAFITAVILEFLGKSGKSGSGRYCIVNSLANVPVVYMTWIDGRGYALWGPRGMPGVDAILSIVTVSLVLAHFVFSRRGRAQHS